VGLLQLQDWTEQVLQLKFPPYEPSHEQQQQKKNNHHRHHHGMTMWEACDDLVQKGEYVLRGHAACIPNSLHYYSNNNKKKGDNDNNVDSYSSLSPAAHIGQMQAIVQHFETEGKLYMDQRRELLRSSSLTLYNQDNNSSSSSSSDDDEESKQQQQQDDDNDDDDDEDCAGPGPTVEMWDTLLDSMAVTASRDTPSNMTSILQRVLERHAEDGGAERNTNPFTVPTILTFNAVLRGVANTPYSNHNNNDDEIREEALQTAFGVYDEMRLHHVGTAAAADNNNNRNAATYTYMLQVVAKFLPPSRTRGNIAHGLWTHAKRNHVASKQVLEALTQHANVPSNGVEFDQWTNDNNNNNVNNMPLNWRKNYKMRRYNRNDETY
jgi:hypothetical protein